MKSISFLRTNTGLSILGRAALMLVAIPALFSLSLTLSPACVLAQTANAVGGTLTTPPPTQIAEIGDISTFWSLTKLGGGISFAIFIILAIGIFLITMQVYELVMDKLKSKELLATNYRQYSVNEVTKLVKNSPNSLIARLYAVLLTIFHTTGSTQDFHDEVANYLQLQQDKFDTFKSRLIFLSDTAGALGLLGTVWGMFVTFFGGNLDSQRILNGMGLALVTTLIGLVVSIILNFCSTEVFSVFNKRLQMTSSKSDEFRLWLMAVVQKRHKKETEASAGGNHGSGQPSVQKKTQPPTSRASVPSLSLQAVSDFNQDGIIGQPLAQPITVRVESQDGQKMAGVPIRYEVTSGGGVIAPGRQASVVRTNQNGLASLRWTMGQDVGAQRLHVSLENNRDSRLEFASLAQPFIPNLCRHHDVVHRRPANGGIEA